MLSTLAQLDAGSIVSVGSILLTCGTGALFVVRFSNPRLWGVGWFAAAFAAGGTGAMLLTMYGQVPTFFAVILSDLLVLLSFVLLHVAIRRLRKSWDLFPPLGAILMLIQFAGYWLMTYVHPTARGRIALFGLTLSTQVAATVVLLIRGTKRGVRMPAWFSAAILTVLIAMNLARTVAILLYRQHLTSNASHELQALTFLVFIVCAMGIGFGFFWMTTAELSFDLEHMASTDPLTRVYNRRVFLEWCEKEISRSRRSQTPFSVVMMDLDHFKSINDRYGHLSGDEMLCAVVEKMQDSVRGIDILGRWGGEEFVALLPGAGSDDAMVVAQRVRMNVEKLQILTSQKTLQQTGEEIRMTVSVGVATYRGSTDEIDEILKRADRAMYGAKAAGRNMVLVLT